MTRSFAFLPLVAMMMACTPMTPAENDTATPAGVAPEAPPAANGQTPAGEGMQGLPMVCNAEPIQTLVGRPYTETTAKDAQARSGAKSMRLIRPGMAVTMDFRSDRLNIEVDDKSVITAIRCG